MPSRARLIPIVAGAALAASSAGAGDRLVAGASLEELDVIESQPVVRAVRFIDAGVPITGVGLSAQYVGISEDVKRFGPWARDLRVTVIPPGATKEDILFWSQIGGDRTPADFPLQDATPGLPAVNADGVWHFIFDTRESLPDWAFGLRGIEVHLLTDAPEVVTVYNAEPDPADEWIYPSNIETLTLYGPAAYDTYTFTVPVSGRYRLESVHPSASRNFTHLYQDGFDPDHPLDNLLDYSRGTYDPSLGTPSGTSRIDALLFAGRTYTWVTSEWNDEDAIVARSNTITGPSAAVEAGDCVADFDGDGTVNILDVVAFITNWNVQGPGSDFNDDAQVNILDVVDFITTWNTGCP